MDIKNFDGIIFDLDGTFIDSMDVWHEVDVEFFKRRGIPLPPDYKEKIKTMHFVSAAEYTKKEFNLPDSVESIIEEWRSLCMEQYKTTVPLKDGAGEFIAFCKENGLKTAYATASDDDLCRAVLEHNCVLHLFDSKTYVHEVGKDKTHPDVYLLAAEKIGVAPSNCIVVEDILAGLKSAKSAGFTAVAMFDKSSQSDWREMCKAADKNIKSFSELMPFTNK